MITTLARPAIVALDAAVDQLAALGPNWDGHGAPRIDRQILTAARSWLRNLPDSALAISPAVVPLASGVLQFEWHIGPRTLEIEFEAVDLIHYLKWDSSRNIEEEAAFPAGDLQRSEALIDWVQHG